jgi:hypothetical protein
MANTAPNLAQTDSNGIEQNKPTVLNTGDGQQSGLPTTASLARGNVTGTTLNKMNSSLEHVCDITGGIRYSIAWVSFKISEAVQAIRTYLEGLWGGASGSPFGDQVRAAVKYIKGKIDILKNYIKKAQEAQSAVQKFISEAQALLAYIQTLPAKAAALLKKCIIDAISSIKDAAVNAKSIISLDTANNEVSNVESTLSTNESIVPPTKIVPQFEKP